VPSSKAKLKKLSLLIFALTVMCWTRLPFLDAAPQGPPVEGRPADFNGAIGVFKISTRAAPTDLQAEDSLILIVRIASSGGWDLAPRRPDLKAKPEFTNSFEMQNLAKGDDEPPPGIWEFRYSLRPRNAGVHQIPPVRFVYYCPGVIPPEKGYRSTYAAAIPIKVRPREQVGSGDVTGPGESLERPEDLLTFVEDPAVVLRRERPLELPGLWAILGALLVPPVAWLLWLAWARRSEADALVRKRTSRAAREALQALRAQQQKLVELTDGYQEAASRAATIFGEYVVQRSGGPAAELTAGELALRLEQSGAAPMATAKAAEWFRTCDHARFGCGQGAAGDLIASAAKIILELESEGP
jgi:hypothetical protein